MSQDTIIKVMEAAYQKKLFPGAAMAAYRNGELFFWQIGRLRFDRGSAKVDRRTIYDTASITKFITAILALQLIEAGRLSLSTKVKDVGPAVQNTHTPIVGDLTIRDLLTSRFSWPFSLSRWKSKDPAVIFNKIMMAKPTVQTNEIVFNNASFVLLSTILEKVSGQTLSRLWQNRIQKVLKLSASGWGKSLVKKQTAPTERDPWRKKEICGEIHDESAWKFWQKNRAVGSAGLFASVEDLVKIMISLLTKKDERLLNEKSKALLVANHLQNFGLWAGLGLEINKKWMGVKKRSLLGKTGFTGGMIVFDWRQRRGLVVLSNATYPRRPSSRFLIARWRQNLCDAIFAD